MDLGPQIVKDSYQYLLVQSGANPIRLGNNGSVNWSAGGVVASTGNQTISGTKTFSSVINGSITGSAGSVSLEGVSGFGSGVATFLATPTSANLAAAVTDIANLQLTPAQIMSAVGERLVASLRVGRSDNAGQFFFATSRTDAGSISVKTTTGYARLLNSDGTLGAQVGTGVASNTIVLTVPASGLHRPLGVLSVVNGGSAASGSITSIAMFNNQLTSFSGTGLSSLLTLNLDNNQLTSFSGTGLSSLTSLSLTSNQLPSFSGTGLSSLLTLSLSNNLLTTFFGTGLSSLTSLILNNNPLTTFSGTGLSSLQTITLNSTSLATLDVAGLTAIRSITAIGNPNLSNLSSVPILTGLRNISYSTFAMDFASCAFTAAQINAIFTALPSATNGAATLRFPLNPGSATANASIATAKGYTVNL